MEIRLIKNFSKGNYRAVNNDLMLQLVDGNSEFDGITSKRIFLFNPGRNEHIEIMPEISKFDIFKIYHGVKDKDFFIFSHIEMRSESEVLIDYYCYRIEDTKCSHIHTDVVSLETFRRKDSIKIFALTPDFCMFQTYNAADHRYDITLKDVTDGSSIKILNSQLSNEGLDCIIPLGGNKCCFKVGSSCIGIVNINQFVSDMLLHLPLVFTQILDSSAGDVEFTDMYNNNNNIIYARRIPNSDMEEIVIYDYLNDKKKIRHNDNALGIFDYKRLCVMGDVPYVYYTDASGTHFFNLNSQREDYLIPPNYNVELVLGEYIITSRPTGFAFFKNVSRSAIEVFRIPDITHHVYRKKGVYNGYVILNEDLLLFLS